MEISNAHCARRAAALLRPLAAEHPHLAYEQLEALAEGKVIARGILARHVRECRICSNELNDMKAFVRSFRAVAPRTKASWTGGVLRHWFGGSQRLAGVVATVVAVTAGLYLFQIESQRARNAIARSRSAAAHAEAIECRRPELPRSAGRVTGPEAKSDAGGEQSSQGSRDRNACARHAIAPIR